MRFLWYILRNKFGEVESLNFSIVVSDKRQTFLKSWNWTEVCVISNDERQISNIEDVNQALSCTSASHAKRRWKCTSSCSHNVKWVGLKTFNAYINVLPIYYFNWMFCFSFVIKQFKYLAVLICICIPWLYYTSNLITLPL